MRPHRQKDRQTLAGSIAAQGRGSSGLQILVGMDLLPEKSSFGDGGIRLLLLTAARPSPRNDWASHLQLLMRRQLWACIFFIISL